MFNQFDFMRKNKQKTPRLRMRWQQKMRTHQKKRETNQSNIPLPTLCHGSWRISSLRPPIHKVSAQRRDEVKMIIVVCALAKVHKWMLITRCTTGTTTDQRKTESLLLLLARGMITAITIGLKGELWDRFESGLAQRERLHSQKSAVRPFHRSLEY